MVNDLSWNQIFEIPEGSTVMNSSAPLFTSDVDNDEIVCNRSRFRKRGSQHSDDDNDDVPTPKRVRISKEFFDTPAEDDEFEQQDPVQTSPTQTTTTPTVGTRLARS